jgi:hypothetical protein
MPRKKQQFPRRLFAKQWSPERTEKHRKNLEAQRFKDRARYRSDKALEEGILERQPCSVCGATQSDDGSVIQKHHADYTKPLEVRWLCRLCHINEHIRLRGNIPSRAVPFNPKPNSSAEVLQAAEEYNRLLEEHQKL